VLAPKIGNDCLLTTKIIIIIQKGIDKSALKIKPTETVQKYGSEVMLTRKYIIAKTGNEHYSLARFGITTLSIMRMLRLIAKPMHNIQIIRYDERLIAKPIVNALKNRQ